jgi:small subunit ribosomal protein S18
MTENHHQQRIYRYRKRVCRFCNDKTLQIDYKNPQILMRYMTESGKILSRKVTGVCAKHQRELTRAIKRARIMAILPFTVK